jgi:hypothetical protein
MVFKLPFSIPFEAQHTTASGGIIGAAKVNTDRMDWLGTTATTT